MTTPTTEPDHGITPQMVAEATGGMVDADTPGLVDVIEGVVSAVRRWCGWHVWPVRTETVTLDGPDTRSLQLPTLRLLGVEDVILAGEPVDADAYTWSQRGWLTRQYPRSMYKGLLNLSRGFFSDLYGTDPRWPAGDRAVVVTMQHGFDTAPDVVRIVCSSIARITANPASLSSLRVGERQESYSTAGIAGGLGGLVYASDFTTLALYRLPDEV